MGNETFYGDGQSYWKNIHICADMLHAITYVPVNEASTSLPRATPRAFEFLENFCSNSPLTGPKAVQMPPPPGKSPDYCFNFSVASIMPLKLCM